MAKVLARRAAYRQMGAFALLLAVLVSFLVAQGGLLQQLGLLFLGALIAFLSIFATDEVKRAIQLTDLARALYEELANRVARCLFDFEEP